MAKPRRAIQIYVSKEDQWLLDSIIQIVEMKKKSKRKSSVSWELLRLAKNGLLRELSGADFDREILLKEILNVHTQNPT